MIYWHRLVLALFLIAAAATISYPASAGENGLENMSKANQELTNKSAEKLQSSTTSVTTGPASATGKESNAKSSSGFNTTAGWRRAELPFDRKSSK
jgi:hypothetical protein